MRLDHIQNERGDYVAFLVEWRNSPKGLMYLTLDIALQVRFATEADDAVHFARRSDAEKIVENAPDHYDLHIVDHMWPGGVPRDRVVQYPEVPR